MTDPLDAAAVRRWSRASVRQLENHRAEIDRLNVFPIADMDTGTNMAFTFRAGDDALHSASCASAGEALTVLAKAAVLAARGNSGVLLAQLISGMADAAVAAGRLDAGALAEGLRRGAAQARAAVADPVEGTILTVARAAADAVPAAARTAAAVATAAVEAAAKAVVRTREQLPVLASAGVVDAGAQGYLLVLTALADAVGAEPSLEPLSAAPPEAGSALPAAAAVPASSARYEVQFLLEALERDATLLRGQLDAIGDSVAVAGTGDGVWNVHAHVDDVGAAIEAGVAAGRPREIRVVDFADGAVARGTAPDDTGVLRVVRGTAPPPAVVAVSPGHGLARLFEAEGVRVVPGPAPSVETVTAAVRACAAEEAVLLPNASQTTGVAEAAADQLRGEGYRVAVVPTRSPVQGLAAVAVHDRSRSFDDDVIAMAEAAAATRYAEVTVAARRSLTSVGICEPGDVLGLIDGEVVEIGRGEAAVALALTDRLLGIGAELMTVLVGSGARVGLGRLIADHIRGRSPLTEVSVYDLGQSDYPVIIGAE